MQYVLLIHAAESRYAARSEAENNANLKDYVDFTNELMASGKGGDLGALQYIDTATSVRVRSGKRIVKDGPFAETREQLGGYYAVDVPSVEEALDWAAKIPDATIGTIEVRPLRRGMPPVAEPKKEGSEYMLLIYEEETAFHGLPVEERETILTRYRAFGKELADAGKFVSGSQLESVKAAKSLSIENGKRIVRDGPFAETREQLGGYFHIYARDLDEAIALAAKIPAAETGTIEVRPLMDLSQFA